MLRSRGLGTWFFSVFLSIALWVGMGSLAAQERSFLWKVHSDKANLHILGSIHYLKLESYPLKRVIEESFENSKKLVLEIDLNAVNPERIQQLTLEKGVYRDGKTLERSISEETYELAGRRAKQLGIDLRAMSSLKPWLVALNLTALQLQKLGYDSDRGVDRYLAERARKANKPIAGLESVESALGLFDDFSPRDQESMLRQTLKGMDALETSIGRIVQAWQSGDSHLLDELLLSSMREYPELYRKMIEERNRRWMPQIEQLLAQGENALVVVGAAHLVGKAGLVELLRERGYRVEQR